MRKRDDHGLAREAEVLLDARLADVWAFAWTLPGEDSAGLVAGLLRLAYVAGYIDALGEQRPGRLFEELGVTPPLTSGRPRARPRSRSARPGNWGT